MKGVAVKPNSRTMPSKKAPVEVEVEVEEEDDQGEDTEDDSEEDEKCGGEDEEDEENEDEGDDEDEDEDDLPLSDILDQDDLEDVISHQKLTIDNHAALASLRNRIAVPIAGVPFVEHQSLTASEPIKLPSIDDDLNRELAFYKQALEAAKLARKLLRQEKIPFERPVDYFAEMMKDDEHMGKVKGKLLEEAEQKKRSQEARKLRDLKKFGKQVQVAKLQEREKEKKKSMEKIQILKRSKSGENTGPCEPALICVQSQREPVPMPKPPGRMTCSILRSTSRPRMYRAVRSARKATEPATTSLGPRGKSGTANTDSAGRRSTARATTRCRAAISEPSRRRRTGARSAPVVVAEERRQRQDRARPREPVLDGNVARERYLYAQGNKVMFYSPWGFHRVTRISWFFSLNNYMYRWNCDYPPPLTSPTPDGP